MTARQFANRTRSALEWLQGHADILPEPTSLTVWGVSKPELVWHDDESYADRVGRMTQHFGPGSTVLGHEYERTYWPAEGDRPTLTVQRTQARARADFPHRTRTSVTSAQSPGETPEGWVLRPTPDGKSSSVAWHLNGALYRFSDATAALGRVSEEPRPPAPLRPTVTEADVEKAARAARAAYLNGVDEWDETHQHVRDVWMKTVRAALDALDIEVTS